MRADKNSKRAMTLKYTGELDMTAPNITPFHQNHIEAGGKLVDFAGWELPVNYGSQIAEH